MPGPGLQVTDKRRNLLTEAEASVVLDGETQSTESMKISIRPEEMDPIDLLLAKTFNYILAQPEFLVMLNLPREVRKKIGQDFGRMLSRVPHMGRAFSG